MGNTFSFLPTWLGGQSPERDPALELEDDSTAGIEATTAQDAVSKGHRAWASHFEDRNFAAVAKLYTRDCKICPSGTRTAYGRQECAMGWESLLATGVDRVVFSNTCIESSGDELLSEHSQYQLYGQDGKAVIDSGKHIMIWRKINHKWFIHLHIFSSNKQAEKGPYENAAEACFMWEYAYFMRDFQSVSHLYTEDCVLCPPAWPQVEGNLPVQRFWARFPSMGVDRIERSVVSVDDMGPSHLSVEISYTMFDYRNAVIDMGKSMIIYKKTKDGRWCIHNEVFNSDASIAQLSTENEEEGTSQAIGDVSTSQA